jgi:hypothetical protein
MSSHLIMYSKLIGMLLEKKLIVGLGGFWSFPLAFL